MTVIKAVPTFAQTAPAQRLRIVASVLLLFLGVHLVDASSKYACDFSNRLCQWKASYMFGATVMGDLAFFNGGILSNDASTPVNGSAFEVLDLRTMSPLVVQVQDNKTLSTSRYRHQLVIWNGKILAVGGQQDDSNGASQHVINIIGLDLNTREWTLVKQFTQPAGEADVIFEASVVVGDKLLMAYSVLDPRTVRRELLHLDLNTGKVAPLTFVLATGVPAVLEWPLVGIVPLSNNKEFPYLVVQFKRQPTRNEDAMWFEVTGESDVPSVLPFSASTALKQLAGASDGKLLTLSVLQVMGKPRLITWAVTAATFANGRREAVNAVSMYDVKLTRSNSNPSVTLNLVRIFLTLPYNVSSFSDLESVDLPLHGKLAVSAADVVTLPYLGTVDLVAEKDSSNVNIQEWPGRGFFVRGSSLADYRCQPIPTWQPFILSVNLAAAQAAPEIRVVSNNTWCNTRRAQLAVTGIVGDAAELQSNTKLFRVESDNGPVLMALGPQRVTNPGGQLSFPDTEAPLRGSLINVGNSTVQSFSVPAINGYRFPNAVASCVAELDGTPVYLQAGGYYLDPAGPTVSTDCIAVPIQSGRTQTAMIKVAGSNPATNTVFSGLACSPDGTVYTFGGLKISYYDEVEYGYYDQANDVVTKMINVPVWAATGSLHAAQLGGSLTAPSLSQHKLLSKDAAAASKKSVVPEARSGHTLTYLPPETVANLGLSKGALLLYGGSNITELDLSAVLTDEAITAQVLANATFGRSAWLFDLAFEKWMRLQPDGLSDAPPGLMYHSAVVAGTQVILWGGLCFVPQNLTMRISTDMYVLDFSERKPRWRKAAVENINVQGAFQLDFPNSGVAALPESGVVALMHRSGISLTAIPQSLQSSGSNPLSQWGIKTLNLTAGDWIRLEIPTGPEGGLTVQQPLLIGGDVIVTGVPAAAETAAAGGVAARGLLQRSAAALPVLRCGRNATAAVAIRSPGAVLEGLTIAGCNDTAVSISVDATGSYTSPATLRNVRITDNNGTRGSAISVGPAAAAVLDSCVISSNNATDSNVYAAAGSQLMLINSTVADNQGTGVLFAGSTMTVTGCRFSRNVAATIAAASKTARSMSSPLSLRSTAAVNGGALRVACVQDPLAASGCFSEVVISNSSFTDNKAESLGGAVYLGAGSLVRLIDSNFSSNEAGDGGAVAADRDACLYNMTGVRFENNMANKRGGGVLMRGVSCRDSITWQEAVFRNNTAGAGGGAMHIAEVINRNISGQAAFYNNTVVGRSAASSRSLATAQAAILDTCDGGALFLGLWNSNVTLYNTTFINNSATGSGGAVDVLSIDSQVNMVNVTALGNSAGVPLTTPRSYGQAVQSEGGVVNMRGSAGKLLLLGVDMTGNSAGRGGAVCMNPGLGEFSSVNSSFANNTGLIAGGAVAVTQHKTAVITNTSFHGNRLRWPDLAAGGGFYCFLCDRVVIRSSHFNSNIASYGGGAAVLQPSGLASILETLFSNNVALPGLYIESEAQRRRLLGAPAQPSDSTALWSPLQVQHLPGDVLGPIAGNTTGDSGYYTGGGGLYVSVNGKVYLNDSGFVDNIAWNGGGLVARTEACRGLQSFDQPCQLVMSNISIMNGNLATGAGNGLLVTEVDPASVILDNCSAGKALNLTTTSRCLLKANKLTAAWQSTSSNNRLLLGLSTEDDSAVATAASDGHLSDFLVTSAASMQCRRLIDTSNSLQWSSESCQEVVRAGPGVPIDVAVQLMDGLGRPVANGTFDAQMPMMASLLHADGISRPNILLIGNTTQAIAGRAYFPGLRINGKPGTRYQLVFKTRSGLNLTRDLVLRDCQAGEITLTESYSSDKSYQCEPCMTPEYSFYPEAGSCGQCPLLQQAGSSYSICSGAAVVPADGVYQSHPRSPLLHRCITSSACTRSLDTQLSMAQWANAHAAMSITELNHVSNGTSQPYYQPYMDLMCTSGYSGPLCGSCVQGYGHSGQRCIQCMSRNMNNLLFLLAGLFMFLVPALQTWMHSKKVQRRHNQSLGVESAALDTVMSVATAGRRQQGSGRPPWLAEHVPGESNGLVQKSVQMAQMHGLLTAGSAVNGDVAAAAGKDQHPSVVHSLTPYMSGVVPTGAAAAAVGINGHMPAALRASGTHRYPSEGSSIGIGPFASPSATPDALRLPSGDQQLPYPPAAAAGQSAAHQGLPSSGAVQTILRKSASTGFFGSLFSTDLLDMSDNLVVVAHQQLQAEGAAAGAVAQADAKFYHTDIVTMIVSYMQLLGLLRFVRLNWTSVLRPLLATLTFLDFTSGVSTWISLECSFNEGWVVPKSLKRSLVLLLWPIGTLLFLGVVWVSYAVVSTWRRGVTAGVLRKLLHLRPYMVLSALTMTYFIYTPTSREVISLFSCQPVDTIEALERVAPQYSSTPDAVDALGDLTPADSRWQGVWSSDTSVSCGSAVHMGIALGLGIPGLLVWVLGLPVALWVILKRQSGVDELGRRRLDEPKVELMFGLMYDKYRRKRYYWECVVLLENCALTMLLVLLQPQSAPLQIMVAMAVIFIGVVLHISFRPYACRMLDTLRRLAVYGLMGTLFIMMLVSLAEFQQMPGLSIAAVVVILVINLAVLGIHCWAILTELRRWILYELNVTDRDQLTWDDVRNLVQAVKSVVGSQASQLLRGFSADKDVAVIDQVRGDERVPGRLRECASGAVTTVNAV